MSDDDWFRRSTWSREDQRGFRGKLARSRGQRSEYLRIQALTLAQTNDPELCSPAINLARQYLDENPEGIFRAQVFLTIATASSVIGDLDVAVQGYRDAIEAERRQPNVHELAYLQFAWFAATRDLLELFDEVLRALDTMKDEDLALPFWQYRYFGARAIISSALGDPKQGSRMARRAIDAAGARRGPFQSRPEVGVVRIEDEVVHRCLEELAG